MDYGSRLRRIEFCYREVQGEGSLINCHSDYLGSLLNLAKTVSPQNNRITLLHYLAAVLRKKSTEKVRVRVK